jgi:hypothetical protein
MAARPAERYDLFMNYMPISEEIANEARESLRDRFGHQLHVVRETAPCRVCLRIPSEPEELILLSYQPLPDTGPYAEIGPVFIHATRCAAYARRNEFPRDFANRRLVLRAYGRDGSIADALVAEPGEAPQRAAEFLDRDDVAEVHVRHESYTCFDFKIVRES